MVTTTTGLATSFIQFTRTSNATVTDSDGKIKWAGHNLLTNSESFDNSAWTLASVTVATPTKVAANAAVAPNGTTTADEVSFPAITVSTDASLISNSFTAVATTYTGGVWLKAKAAGDVGKKVAVYVDDGSVTNFVFHTLTADWVFVSATEAVSAGTVKLSIAVLGSAYGGGNQGAVSVYLWGAHLYRSDLGGMVLNPARGDAYYPTTPRNLLGFTEDFSNAAWSKTAASVVSNSVIAPNGLQTADTIVEDTTNNVHRVFQGVTITLSPHTLSFYAKPAGRNWVYIYTGTGSQTAYVNIATGAVGTTSGAPTVTLTSAGNGWYRVSFGFTNAVSGAQNIQLMMASADGTNSYTGDGTSGIYLWGAQLSDSASLDAYSPVYGAAVTSAAYYAPRLDFDPVTLAARGLLVEEQRANAVTYSSDFSQWVNSGALVTTNSVVAPDGTQTADELARDTSQSDARYIGVSFTGDGSKALSFYVKYNTSPSFTVFLYDTSVLAGRVQIQFGFTAGVPAPTVTTQGSVEAIEAVGSGWYRIKVVATGVVAANTNRFYLYPAQSGSANGQKTTFWGAQAEVQTATFSTSLIPTNGATATRTADVASVSTQAFPYSASEGTIVASARVLSTSSSLNTTLWSFYTDGNNNIRSWIWTGALGQPRGTLRQAGSQPADMTNGSISANTAFKNAFAYKNGDYGYSLNGAAAATSTTALALTNTYSSLDLGRSGSLGDYLNGHIRQITFIPRRLSNAELQARTV